jgi:TRAP-type C4-dicarboxylate transport system permease small subunit
MLARKSGGEHVRKLLDGLYLGAGYLAGVFLFIVFAIMMIMSVGRQFGLNIPAGDDFASWAMAAMSFLGLAHTFKRGEIIRVGLLLERLKGRPKQVFELLALGISLVAISYFSWHTCRMVYDSWRFNDMAQGVVAVPLWIPQIGVAAGLIILAIAVLDEFVHVLRGNKPRYEKDPPKTTEELIARVAEGGGV